MNNKELREGEPCSHKGCLNHITHPCEGCGRIEGRNINDTYLEKIKKLINNLTPREKEILKLASTSIYLNSNSLFKTALWNIINLISDEQILDCNTQLFKLLDEEE